VQAERALGRALQRPRRDRERPHRRGRQELAAIAHVGGTQRARPRQRVRQHQGAEQDAEQHVPPEQRHAGEAGIEPARPRQPARQHDRDDQERRQPEPGPPIPPRSHHHTRPDSP
jgi:hypothetical protein